MKKLFLALALLLSCLSMPPQASAYDFVVMAKRMYPGTDFTDDCTLKAPLRKCCTDASASSCSNEGCQASADCSAPNSVCSVIGGDNGFRCCTDVTASSCQTVGSGSKDAVCNSNGDCTGNTLCTGSGAPFSCCSGPNAGSCGSFTTCAGAAYTGGSELPFPKWECADAGSPKLYFETTIPDSITTNSATCYIDWNSKSLTGNGVFKMRAVVLNSAGASAAPSLTGSDFPSTTSAAATRPYWRKKTSGLSFCLEDANTAACCSGSACHKRRAKFEITVDSGTTVANPPRIALVFCTIS